MCVVFLHCVRYEAVKIDQLESDLGIYLEIDVLLVNLKDEGQRGVKATCSALATGWMMNGLG